MQERSSRREVRMGALAFPGRVQLTWGMDLLEWEAGRSGRGSLFKSSTLNQLAP